MSLANLQYMSRVEMCWAQFSSVPHRWSALMLQQMEAQPMWTRSTSCTGSLHDNMFDEDRTQLYLRDRCCLNTLWGTLKKKLKPVTLIPISRLSPSTTVFWNWTESAKQQNDGWSDSWVLLTCDMLTRVWTDTQRRALLTRTPVQKRLDHKRSCIDRRRYSYSPSHE